VLLARALVLGGDRKITDTDALVLASRLEGHPDNVAACLLGGFTIAWTDGAVDALRLEPAGWLRPILAVPPQHSSTHLARSVLPARVPHLDAAYNAGRSALLVAAVLGAPDVLLAATDDRLHQPYRADSMPDSAALVARLRAEGVAAMISGAGPTVLTLARNDGDAAQVAAQLPAGWTALPVSVDLVGAHIVAPVR
jgi:homoserine kinase